MAFGLGLRAAKAEAAANAAASADKENAAQQANAMEQSAAASKQALDASKKALADEKAKSLGLEEENKALRGQVATVLSYLDQVMPMEDGGANTMAAAGGPPGTG